MIRDHAGKSLRGGACRVKCAATNGSWIQGGDVRVLPGFVFWCMNLGIPDNLTSLPLPYVYCLSIRRSFCVCLSLSTATAGYHSFTRATSHSLIT